MASQNIPKKYIIRLKKFNNGCLVNTKRIYTIPNKHGDSRYVYFNNQQRAELFTNYLASYYSKYNQWPIINGHNNTQDIQINDDKLSFQDAKNLLHVDTLTEDIIAQSSLANFQSICFSDVFLDNNFFLRIVTSESSTHF